MICEALLFVSAIYLYIKSIKDCFPQRNVRHGENEESDDDIHIDNTSSRRTLEFKLIHENIHLKDAHFLVRMRTRQLTGFAIPLYIYDEYLIPINEVLPVGEKKGTEEDCSICLEPFQEIKPIRTLPCGHSYCESCILAWLKTSTKCPLCNQNCVELWMTQRQESVSTS